MEEFKYVCLSEIVLRVALVAIMKGRTIKFHIVKRFFLKSIVTPVYLKLRDWLKPKNFVLKKKYMSTTKIYIFKCR